jgi:hypothetical protein
MAERLELVRRLKKSWLDRDGPPPDSKEWQSINVARPPRRTASE